MVNLLLYHSLFAYLLLLSCPGRGGLCASEEPVRHRFSTERDIYVDLPLGNENILVNLEEKRYRPVGLEPGSSYELRVSYVSSHSVQIRFGYACAATSMLSRERHGRKLLNAEKMMFTTDAKGAVNLPAGEGSCGMMEQVMLTVQVLPWGMMKHTMNETQFEYDVVLEKNYLGIPVSSVPVLGMALCMVGILLVVGVGWWMHLMKHWWYMQMDDERYHKNT